ncbi:SymE family type I addiction module toxin [Eubacterium sp.]|uniref:SymE family type I addiction module toxin n=1 Tax=Eubacterium sp. TaxID=142586 RepID=UPI00258307D6|nr:SymE family type I addiction module toxin [Eubacterium sp.]MCR5367875.1 type I toxin-antitoxin system SymE family toxin [Eubacterium sp.]
MAFKKTRNMKVYGMSGYRYRSTPTIQLKGEWLKEIGFDIGDYISITCENGRRVITPDAERAALTEAEDAFMEKETKLLQKRFEAEKKRLHEQFVAERKAEYAVVAEPGLEV